MTETQRLDWLLQRQSGIGSSDAPDVVGRGWGGNLGPARVYRSKVEPPDPRLPRSGALRRGHDLEPVAAALYEEVMGVRLATVPLVRNPDRPWMIASNDRTRDDGVKVELKTVSSFGDGWGEQGSDDIPEGYLIQVQHQMAVTDARFMDLFALNVNDFSHRVFRIDENPELQAWLVGIETAFWCGHVTVRRPPGEEWLDFVGKNPSPLPEVEGVLDLGDEWASICDLRKNAMRDREVADVEVKQLTEQIKARMGGARRAVAGPWTIRRTEVAGCHVEYDRESYVRLDVRSRNIK